MVRPTLRRLAVLDRLVFLAAIVVARHRDDGGIKDLSSPRDITLSRKIAVELLEQRLHQACLRQRLAIKPDRLGIGHPVLKPEAEEPHEGQPITHLVFDLVVGQVIERAQHQRLEHQNGVHGLAPRC